MYGIFYDRDDYCDFDYAHYDGVTMIGPDSVYMLGFAQEKINDSILNKVHCHNDSTKGVWTNQPTSVEVCKKMDGIMSEDLHQAPFQQYFGITRPLILLPYDITEQQAEEKLKTALYTGHFPSVTTYPESSLLHSGLMDNRYKPLFSLYKGKKWVLYPHALQLPEGIKGNIFQAPDSDYLVAMIEPERYSSKIYLNPEINEITRDVFRYDRQVKVQVPDNNSIKYCYLLSGDYQGVNQDSIHRNLAQADIEITPPTHRVSSLIQLSKDPRYEVTRISSPVLTRGDSEELVVRIQNIRRGKSANYDFQLITPFTDQKNANFTLDSLKIIEETLGFKIPKDEPLGEDTIKVYINDETPIVLTTWVVDLVTFQLPEKLFVHFVAGDTIPFLLVNNTGRKLNVTLKGEFVEDSGQIRFPILSSQDVALDSLETKELLVFIKPDEEVDTVKIFAIISAENDTVCVIRPVERSMDTLGTLFHDDFSSRNMSKWDTVYGRWDASDRVAKDTEGGSHLALKIDSSHVWCDYQFQVNTKLKGSSESKVDWLRSFIYFRVQDTSHYYCFGFSGWSAADEINLFKRETTNWSLLAKYPLYPFKIKKDVWYNLRVDVKDDSIKCFLDGNQVFCVRDSGTRLTNGGVGIGVLHESMRNYYDDVIVRER